MNQENEYEQPIYHPSKHSADETTLEEFFEESDQIKQDKIEIQEKGPRRTIQITKHENNSGMGEQAPYSISRKFNWGAFLFNFIWGLKYKKFALLLIPLFCCIPYGFIISIIMCIWAGIKGNQWAWEEIQYKNEKDFHNAQKSWVKAWAICAGIISIIVLAISLVQKNNTPKTESPKFNIANYNPIMTLELTIPENVYNATDSKDNHADILLSPKYIIYWLRASNSLTEKNLEYIQQDFNKNRDKLEDKFILYPDLKKINDKNSNLVDMNIEAICINGSGCIDEWLYENCNTGYCIINPTKRTYYKVRTKESLIPKAITTLNKWKQ